MLTKKEAEKKLEQAIKKGYSGKISGGVLIIIAGKKRTEERVSKK